MNQTTRIAAISVMAGLLSTLALAQVRSPRQSDATSTPEPIGYLVTLREPGALAFSSVSQLASAAKLHGLTPTAPAPNSKTFNAKAPTVVRYQQYLRERQDQVLSELGRSAGKALTASHRWSLVGNGFGVTVDAETAKRLAAHPEVKSVEPDYAPVLFDQPTAASVAASAVWQGAPPTGLGNRGEGIVIGVIDSGIDAAHPAFAEVAADGYRHQNPRGQGLGLCQTVAASRCNNKLIGIYDFGPSPSFEPGADRDGHGTAVASLAAGNPGQQHLSSGTAGSTVAVSGMAPRANIVSYQAFHGPTGSVIAAFDQAVEDRVDVVSMSFGIPFVRNNWNGAYEQALLLMRHAGILPIAAAGNEGPQSRTIKFVPGSVPWVLTVAANRHGHDSRARLTNIHGYGLAAPMSLDGIGLTAALPEAPLVLARDLVPQSPRCAKNRDDSNPFAPGSLTGRIIVCEAGYSDFNEVSGHVRDAGAVGMVFLADAVIGREAFISDLQIPGLLLDQAESLRLRQWLATARAAGQELRASISASADVASPNEGMITSFSSRGPVAEYEGILKPNVAAPGFAVWAAQAESPGYDSFGGTSAAAPIVAGVAALIKSARPNWTPDHIISALSTTALPGLSGRPDGGIGPAGALEAGSGMVQASAAIRAGLSITPSLDSWPVQFLPPAGLQPQLNLPFLHDRQCQSTCTFKRTVVAEVGGQWTASAVMDARAQVEITPTQLQLQSGESAELTIRITLDASTPPGALLEGAVTLQSSSPGVAPTRLPIVVGHELLKPRRVALSTVPGTFSKSVTALLGNSDLEIHRAGLLEAYQLTPWPVRPMLTRNVDLSTNRTQRFTLSKPPAVGNRVRVPGKIFIRSTSASWGNYHLRVYEDTDGNGSPDHEVCSSLAYFRADECDLDVIWTERNQFLYDLIADDSSIEGHSVNVAVYNEVAGADAALRAYHVPNSLYELNLQWSITALPVNVPLVGFIGLERDGNYRGAIRVELMRAPDQPTAAILNPRNDRLDFELAPGQAHEQIIVDVPANQSRLTVRVNGYGDNIDLYLSRLDTIATGPLIPLAPPRGQQPFVAASEESEEVLVLEGANLRPGRYHITPVNRSLLGTNVTIKTEGSFNAPLPLPQGNGFHNPERDGHGVFFVKAGETWALAWYTFDVSGDPIWYTAQGPAGTADDSVWTAPLYRSVWAGSWELNAIVGKVILTVNDAGGFTYSWELDGEYGSERLVPIGTPVCAEPGRSVAGGWLDPTETGWGSYFLNFAGNREAEAIYLYDFFGKPRWLIGEGTYANTASKIMYQVRGFCPTCAWTPPSREPVGTVARTLLSAQTGTFSADVVFRGNLQGEWRRTDTPWARLTPDLTCP